MKGGRFHEKKRAAPRDRGIPVAFLVSDGAVIIDFCGPWEVFQDVQVGGRHGDGLRLYTVAETTRPIRASGGLKVLPHPHFARAPPPSIALLPPRNTRHPAPTDSA